jgi:hypothetical protein
MRTRRIWFFVYLLIVLQKNSCAKWANKDCLTAAATAGTSFANPINFPSESWSSEYESYTHSDVRDVLRNCAGSCKVCWDLNQTCDDSCEHAADPDGWCDDGGVGAQFDLCDFGSDCTDCGVRFSDPRYNSLVTACEESCEKSKNGLCDDGGPGAQFSICSIGSDCEDCGTRQYETDPHEAGSETPISTPQILLRGKKEI